MSAERAMIKLEKLHDLLLRERECAKALDLDGMLTVAEEKKALLPLLESEVSESPELKVIAEKVRSENRRNAFLFWSTLKYIRESMSFLNLQISRPAYGSSGRMQQQDSKSGLVLKGRV